MHKLKGGGGGKKRSLGNYLKTRPINLKSQVKNKDVHLKFCSTPWRIKVFSLSLRTNSAILLKSKKKI